MAKGAMCGSVLIAFLSVAGGACADDFYKGKTVDLILSTGVGGGNDSNARLVAKHWQKHIPGAPSIVVKNMPGGGHLRAANFLANQAPKDGTALGSFVPAFLLAQVLQTSKNIQFNAADFNWLGSSSSSNSTFFVWSTSPVKSIADAKRTEVVMGATGAGSYTMIYPMIMNAIVGTKFKVVSGYKSGALVNLALLRGEVEGRAGNNFNSLKTENADWLRDGKIRIIAQVGLERDPEFLDVPLMMELGETPQDKALLKLFSADVVVGRPFLTAPGVPKERVELLQKSFMATMKDPTFLKEAKEAGLDIAPLAGEPLQKIVSDIVNTPPDVARRAREALDAGAEGKR
jgi:tripartite-type tricarboxylate transporter receptor subunit TctC